MRYLSIFFGTIGYMSLRGLGYGVVFGGILGTLLWPIIGTMYGVGYGAIIGLMVSCLGGAIIGLIIVTFFDPVRNKRIFYEIMRLLGGLLSIIATYAAFIIVFWQGEPLEERFRIVFAFGNEFFWLLVPSLIASMCAFYVYGRFALWYLANSQHQYQQKT